MTGDGRFMVNILNNNDTFRRNHVITARLPGYVFTCVCLSTGVVSQHALQQVLGGGGGIPVCLAGFQAHTQGGSLRGSGWGGSPGPHTRGKLRGIWSRPTAKGEVQGDLVQAHTQGGS